MKIIQQKNRFVLIDGNKIIQYEDIKKWETTRDCLGKLKLIDKIKQLTGKYYDPVENLVEK